MQLQATESLAANVGDHIIIALFKANNDFVRHFGAKYPDDGNVEALLAEPAVKIQGYRIQSFLENVVNTVTFYDSMVRSGLM